MEVLFLAIKEFMIIKENSHMSVVVNCVKKLEDSSPLPKKSTTKDPQKSPLCRVTGKPAIV